MLILSHSPISSTMGKAPSYCAFPGCGNPVWPQNFAQHIVRHLKDGETYTVSMRHQYLKSIVLKPKDEQKREYTTTDDSDDEIIPWDDLPISDKLNEIKQFCRDQHNEIQRLKQRVDQLESASRTQPLNESFDFTGDDDNDGDDNGDDDNDGDDNGDDDNAQPKEPAQPAQPAQHVSKIPETIRQNPELVQATIEEAKKKRTRAEMRRLSLGISADEMVAQLPAKRPRHPKSA